MGAVSSVSRKMASSVPRKPPAYVINPTSTHTASVIFLHGLGDTGVGWSEAMKEIREPHIKYICPTAAVNSVSRAFSGDLTSDAVSFRISIPVTLNAGMRMPSWFDLYALQIGGREDTEGIKRAVRDIVSTLIAEEEKTGIPSNRIVVGGFSQGGALALYSALTVSKPLAGVMSLSGWLPLAAEFPASAPGGNRNVPVLLCHGDSDPLVVPQIGQMTRAKLSEFIPNITAKIYRNLGHSSSEEEMADVKTFIAACLPKT